MSNTGDMFPFVAYASRKAWLILGLAAETSLHSVKTWHIPTRAKLPGETTLSTLRLRSGRPATEKKTGEIQKIAGEGAGESAARIRGAGGSAGEGAARGVFLGKEWHDLWKRNDLNGLLG